MPVFGIIVAIMHISYNIMCPSFFTTYIWCFLINGQLHVPLQRKIQFFNFRWLYIQKNQQRKYYIEFIFLGNHERMQGCLWSTLNFTFMLFCKITQKTWNCNITQKSNIHKKTESTRFNIHILKQRSKFKKHNVYNVLVSETWMSCKMQDTL